MKLSKLGLLAATAFAMVSASTANATVLISGLLTWKPGTVGTALSIPTQELSFSFLADTPTSVQLGTFIAKLNGSPVGSPPSSITFGATGFVLAFAGFTLNLGTGFDWSGAFPGTPYAQGGVGTTINGVGISSTAQISVLSVASAVPEPATWALMLGGFGLAGLTLRSRAAKYKVGYTA